MRTGRPRTQLHAVCAGRSTRSLPRASEGESARPILGCALAGLPLSETVELGGVVRPGALLRLCRPPCGKAPPYRAYSLSFSGCAAAQDDSCRAPLGGY
jgi:hypothetical protein